MTPVRRAAVNVLLAVERGRATLPGAVDRERRHLSDRRDRALLLELSAGTLRWRNSVDYALADASRRHLEDLAPPVRAILRVAAFQLRHLERIPDHAVIHEAVELTRRTGHPRAAGFVNAVLRTVARRRSTLSLPARPAEAASRHDQLEYLSTALSHPEWLVTRWLDRHGFDAAEAWCRFNNETLSVTVRPMRSHDADIRSAAADSGVAFEPAPHVTGAYHVDVGTLGTLPEQVRSRIVVQDEGSQLVACVTPVSAGNRVLDVCASHGNKTVMLADRSGPNGMVVAASWPLPFGDTFDVVLLDAPCSGLGTLRRDPDLKWSRRPSDLERLAEVQARMLSEAAQAVRPGGTLVYATCSGEPEEDDLVVDGFLAGNPDFSPGRLDEYGGARKLDTLTDAAGRLKTFPFRHQLDAFFAAVLVRRQAA
jgi:16S rRNA (cytosine967-C5)-methyltransferase